jgi:photosystem II stability/assembly factor-like uncharacterized protein
MRIQQMTFCLTLILFFFFLISKSQAQWKTFQTNPLTHLRAVHAVDTNTCWIGGSGGTVLKTIDGGEHWQTIQILGADSLDFRDFHAFSSDMALAMSAGASEQDKARIYRTEDGGKSWKIVYQTVQNGVFLDGIDFWDSQRGICMGDPVDGLFFILTTQDGGRTWQELPNNKRPAALEHEAAYAASGTSVITHGNGQAFIGTGGSKLARVIRSSDYGQSWEATTTPLPANASTGIFGLRFWSKKNGMAVGGDYKNVTQYASNVVITTNGGKTWNLGPQTNPVGLKESVGIFGKNQITLIAVGPNGSSFSTNKGQSWQYLGDEAFHAISIVAQTAYAVGANGLIGKLQKLPIKQSNK